MTQHTPGPWHTDARRAASGAIYIYDKTGKAISDAENIADARLIAAAPDMLDALRIAERLLLSNFGLEKVRAAIAKAEGN